MRQLVHNKQIELFMRALGNELVTSATVYFSGGCSAVLHDWRQSTIDIDIKVIPEEATL